MKIRPARQKYLDRGNHIQSGESRAEIENDIKALDEVDGRLNTELHTTERWTALRTASLNLLKNAQSVSADESFARHSPFCSSAQ